MDHVCLCCNEKYDVNNKGADSEFCSFECWEQVNCKTPPIVQFEDLEIAGLLST